MRKLQLFLDELNELAPQEKLEWLMEFADQLPALSVDRSVSPFPDSCRVQECQTPVHLWVTAENGLICIEAAVPESSPLVRGLVALFVVGLNGQPVVEATSLPDDPVTQWHLNDALGMTRQRGIRGMVARIKQGVRGSRKDD